MAVTPGARVEANFGLAGLTTWVSGSHTWTNGTLYTVDIVEFVSGGAPAPTSVAGATMTFVRAANFNYDMEGSSLAGRTTTWVAIGNGNTETITVTFGTTVTDGYLSVMPYTGTKTTSGGADAIRQVVTGANAGSANPSVSLAALQDSGSLALGLLFDSTSSALTVGSGFTSIASFGHASPTVCSASFEYQTNVTTVNWTALSNQWGAVAYEIAAPVVVTFTPLVLTYG